MIGRWNRLASQARHKLVAPGMAVHFAKRGLGYEHFQKLAYVMLNTQTPCPPPPSPDAAA
jgi:hypothetical protein